MKVVPLSPSHSPRIPIPQFIPFELELSPLYFLVVKCGGLEFSYGLMIPTVLYPTRVLDVQVISTELHISSLAW